jgi:branched-chain amino acid transport system permease protein
MTENKLTDALRWCKSIAGIIVLGSVFLAVAGTYVSGPYILINSVVTGGMLALIAMGLALVFGVMNVGMFAHGEFFMVGTLVAFYAHNFAKGLLGPDANAFLVNIAPLIVILVAGLAGAICGIITEILVFRPLRARSKENWVMNTFLLTVGISVIMINLHQLGFGTEFKGIIGHWNGRPFKILGVFVSRDRVFSLLLSLVTISGFWLFMKVTRTGRAIRAVSQDETGAEMVGIGLPNILLLTMALSCGMAAMAGASLIFMYPSYPTVGLEPLYMAWFVVILVGLGNTAGALMGGFIVALFKTLTVEYVGAGWEFVVPTGLIILVLIFKPSGIFGSGVRGLLDQ